MKLKMKYTEDPWFYSKTSITGKGNRKVAEISGDTADERSDNLLLISCAPDMLKALLAEEAYTMSNEEGAPILASLGYVDGSKYAFVKSLRRAALKKMGLAEE